MHGKVGIVIILIFVFLSIRFFNLTKAVENDKSRIIENLKEIDNVKHLELCQYEFGDIRHHEVYLETDKFSTEIEELPIRRLIELASTYIEVNSINRKSLVSITFCKRCIMLPDDNDSWYDEVIEEKNKELIIEFNFNNGLDSLPLRERLNDIGFWEEGKKNNLLDNYDLRKFIMIDSIENLKLKSFYSN